MKSKVKKQNLKVRAGKGNIRKAVLTITCFLILIANIAAQPFSYVYIQGDKSIPFYVKMEGKMQPRYGKNYCIISELSAGTIHIEVLFQQNALPPQKFTIQVPENGYRGLMLSKQEHGFALYDLQQKKYLNTNGD